MSHFRERLFRWDTLVACAVISENAVAGNSSFSSLVPLRSLKHPPETPVWKLGAALYCEPCSEGRHYSRRQCAHILGLTYAQPDPEQPRMPGRKAARNP
jgi:hypothetical protein